MTDITIVSGFVGSGKSSLIMKLVRDEYADEKIVVIENEKGEIDLNEHFRNLDNIDLSGLLGGCVCCSGSANFIDTLDTIAGWTSPDRIIIEPNGTAKVSDIVKCLERMQYSAQVKIDRLITVLDTRKCLMYANNFGDFYLDQIRSAEILVLTHSEGVSEERKSIVKSFLKSENPDAILTEITLEELQNSRKAIA